MSFTWRILKEQLDEVPDHYLDSEVWINLDDVIAVDRGGVEIACGDPVMVIDAFRVVEDDHDFSVFDEIISAGKLTRVYTYASEGNCRFITFKDGEPVSRHRKAKTALKNAGGGAVPLYVGDAGVRVITENNVEDYS